MFPVLFKVISHFCHSTRKPIDTLDHFALMFTYKFLNFPFVVSVNAISRVFVLAHRTNVHPSRMGPLCNNQLALCDKQDHSTFRCGNFLPPCNTSEQGKQGYSQMSRAASFSSVEKAANCAKATSTAPSAAGEYSRPGSTVLKPLEKSPKSKKPTRPSPFKSARIGSRFVRL